ncbi:PEP-CTERM sorting domain-containing protein [Pontiellaceae bacterium B12219]|nr:PEP-CTERM sorting domain-containing protein [Pontiellaceae bacterium B12219]
METGFKIKSCLVCAALLGAASTQAALLVSDSFEVGADAYSEGELLGQDVAVSGMNGAWLNNDSTAVRETGLTYADANYANGTGGSVIANTSGKRVGRLLDTAYNSASEGTVYMSFLMQTLSNNNTTQYKAFELHDGGFDDAANRKFQLGVQGNNFGSTTEFGFRLVNNNAYQDQLDALNTNVNLFVVKFDFSTEAGSDSVTVWQNPDLTGSGDPTGGVTVGGVDMSFDRISFARYNVNDALAWDEVRMGDTFTDVIPEPATLGLISAFGSGLLFCRRRFMI